MVKVAVKALRQEFLCLSCPSAFRVPQHRGFEIRDSPPAKDPLPGNCFLLLSLHNENRVGTACDLLSNGSYSY